MSARASQPVGTRARSLAPAIDPECDNEHLFGLPAIVCIDDRVPPRPNATPIQRCDYCCDGHPDFCDHDAAVEVALASGGHLSMYGDLQWFVTPEVTHGSR